MSEYLRIRIEYRISNEESAFIGVNPRLMSLRHGFVHCPEDGIEQELAKAAREKLHKLMTEEAA